MHVKMNGLPLSLPVSLLLALFLIPCPMLCFSMVRPILVKIVKLVLQRLFVLKTNNQTPLSHTHVQFLLAKIFIFFYHFCL